MINVKELSLSISKSKNMISAKELILIGIEKRIEGMGLEPVKVENFNMLFKDNKLFISLDYEGENMKDIIDGSESSTVKKMFFGVVKKNFEKQGVNIEDTTPLLIQFDLVKKDFYIFANNVKLENF